MPEPLNHTPGPFIIDEGIVRPEDMIDSIRANPTWVAVGIADEDGYSSSVAYCHPMNAQLIAAAPELLATLERLLSIANDGAVMRHETGKPAWSFIDEVKTQARAAITKATTPNA